MRCIDASRFIHRLLDRQLDQEASDALRAHLVTCQTCRSNAETRALVKSILASRPEESVPSTFDAKLTARLDEAARDSAVRWSEITNWNRWNLRLLIPVSVLMLLAVLRPFHQPPVPVASMTLFSSVIVGWGIEPGGVTELVARWNVDDETMLLTLLLADVSVPEEVP